MSQIQQLYQLQRIDTEFRQKKARLGEVLRAQKETPALQAARQRAQTATAALQQGRLQQTDLNLELQGVNDKARRSEQRLYSGNVKNPKELADLQQEIEALGRRRAALEDNILETMILVEDAEAEKTAADMELSQVESRWEQEQIALRQEQHELALRLHQLTEARGQPLAAITPANLAAYEEIAARKHGVAVAELRQNTCQGCQVNVSAQKVRRAQEGELVTCGSCGRLLYPL